MPKFGIVKTPDSILFMGSSVRSLVYKFRQKTLLLFKLLMLGRRVLFIGQRVEIMTELQIALVSLFPELMRNLVCTWLIFNYLG
jgi:hypothetical protein